MNSVEKNDNKKINELKESKSLHERFVQIFSDVNKNNPVNIDVNKEAWPIFLKIVEGYSNYELMEQTDAEIASKCISVQEEFFGQKNIITDGNGNPNIEATIRENPDFIQNNQEIIKDIEYVKKDNFSYEELSILAASGVYKVFLNESDGSVDSKRIDRILDSFWSIDDSSEESMNSIYVSDEGLYLNGIIFSEEDVEEILFDENGNSIGCVLKDGATVNESEIKKPDGTSINIKEIQAVMRRIGVNKAVYEDGNIKANNNEITNKEINEEKIKRKAVINKMGGEKNLFSENLTDEQFAVLNNAIKGEMVADLTRGFEMNDNSIDLQLYVNEDTQFRYMQFSSEIINIEELDENNKEIHLKDGTIVTTEKIKFKDGRNISFKDIQKYMKEKGIDENLQFNENGIALQDGTILKFEEFETTNRSENKEVSDKEAKKFIEDSLEFLNANAINELRANSPKEDQHEEGTEYMVSITNEDRSNDRNSDTNEVENDNNKKSILSRVASLANRVVQNIKENKEKKKNNSNLKENDLDNQNAKEEMGLIAYGKKSFFSRIFRRGKEDSKKSNSIDRYIESTIESNTFEAYKVNIDHERALKDARNENINRIAEAKENVNEVGR